MKSVKTIVQIISIVVKYGAIFTAIIKGIEVVQSELEKIDFTEEKPKK